MKISIIGAGNVGATLAKRVLESGMADVVLLDVAAGLADGKALDMLHSAALLDFTNIVTGTDDYSLSRDCDIAVITAGFPRQPGMSRENLVKKNGRVIKEVARNIKKWSPEAIIIVITNPLDLMAYTAFRESGFSKKRVIGMAGLLDTSRFIHLIAKELKTEHKNIEAIVIGPHNPEMVPVISHTRVSGRPLTELLSGEKIDELIKKLRGSGAQIVNLLGKGSAFYAPSAACYKMIKQIKDDEKTLISASCLVDGEYGLSGFFIGLPVRLGRNGIEEIVELTLAKDEKEAFLKSAAIAKEAISLL